MDCLTDEWDHDAPSNWATPGSGEVGFTLDQRGCSNLVFVEYHRVHRNADLMCGFIGSCLNSDAS